MCVHQKSNVHAYITICTHIVNTKTCLFILFYCLQNLANEETGGKLVSSRLLVKLQVILPLVELRGLCHLNPITLDMALSYSQKGWRRPLRSSSPAVIQCRWSEVRCCSREQTSTGLLKTVTLLCSGLEIWPVTLSQLVRHICTTVSDKRKGGFDQPHFSEMWCEVGNKVTGKNSAQDLHLPMRNKAKLMTDDQLQNESISPWARPNRTVPLIQQ